MTALRYAVPAYVAQGDGPSTVVAKLRKFMGTEEDGGFASAVCGVIGDSVGSSTTKTAVPPRSPLVAFTDGLVERRGESLGAGLERISDAAAGWAGSAVGGSNGIVFDLKHLELIGSSRFALLLSVANQPASIELHHVGGNIRRALEVTGLIGVLNLAPQ